MQGFTPHARRSVAAGALVLLAALAAGQTQTRTTAVAHPAAPALIDAPALTSYANGITTGRSVKNDVSPPLRTLPVQPAAPWTKPQYMRHPGMETNTDGVNINAPDPVVQRTGGSDSPNAMPTPLVSFEGINNQHGGLPPDTVGDVGPNHYVQMVNTDFAVYTKTGTKLYGPALISTLWTNFGAPCENNNDGDPVVLYDQLADRWLLSQFTTVSPFGECVAVSTSADPTGSYYRYFFQFSTTVFYDYPHLGVWPDGYYMGTNRFNGIAGSEIGPAAHVLDRAAMLAGQPATFQEVDLTRGGTLLPADLDGALLPPAGSPDYFLAKFGSHNLDFYKFHVDWAVPANSSLSSPIGITTANYTGLGVNTIPQPGTAQPIDSLGDRLMFRLAYRNFGSYESLVTTHSVDVGQGSTVQGGIRWYEIRSPATTPVLFQQGTFAPADGVSRWMGSAAQDASGNLAVGYSVSDATTTFPGIRYAGRLAADPLGTLNQGEATLINGGGSQTDPSGRWGDYSDLTVDPTDDCTFWYTTEYYGSTSQAAWQTRIGSFKFPGCQSPTATPTTTGTLPTATVTHTPTLSPTPTSTPCAVTSGSLTGSDPTQVGRTARDAITSSCAFPKTYAGAVANDTTPRHYDSYTYTNSSGGPVCVTVGIDATGCGGNQIFVAAYLNSFNPANLATNWLADLGNSPNPSGAFSFTVPAGATYVVVVNEITANTGCAGYTLSVIGACGGVPALTSTPTNSPTNTSTATRTGTATITATATRTSTAVSTGTATRTSTAVPPTSTVTRTAVPPTGTGTNTVTRTPGPNTATSTVTRTAVPPTGTNTATPTTVPPTVTRTATVTPTGCPVGITQNTSLTPVVGSVSCNNSGSTAENHYYRLLPMANYVNGPYAISSVDIGIEEANATSGSQPIQVILRTSSANPPTLASLSAPLATANVTVTNQTLSLINVPISAVVPAGSLLVVEVAVPDGQAAGTRFYIGSNAAGQSGPSYIQAAACGINDITDLANMGFGSVDVIMRVNGSCTIPTATVTTTGTPPTATPTSTAVPPTATVTITETGIALTRTATQTSAPATATATQTSTAVPATNTATQTSVISTATATRTLPVPTRTATATRTPCVVNFSDVSASDYFYEPVQYLACHGVIGGYSDGTFRPYNNTTRGQMAKIVVGAFGLPVTTPAAGGFTFADVPGGSTFFDYVETAAAANIVSGYPCGGVNPQTGAAETCDGASRPYYRGGNFVTRGQLAKIVVVAAQGAAGWTLISPATATFSDVAVGSTFFSYVETAACHSVLGGYSDGTFRPSANATRGQIAKIVYFALGSGASCGPAATPPAIR